MSKFAPPWPDEMEGKPAFAAERVVFDGADLQLSTLLHSYQAWDLVFRRNYSQSSGARNFASVVTATVSR